MLMIHSIFYIKRYRINKKERKDELNPDKSIELEQFLIVDVQKKRCARRNDTQCYSYFHYVFIYTFGNCSELFKNGRLRIMAKLYHCI